MMVSAVWLEMTRRRSDGRIALIGDTLPNALKDKPERYLRRLPNLLNGNGEPLPWT
jgi:hypothetical protein